MSPVLITISARLASSLGLKTGFSVSHFEASAAAKLADSGRGSLGTGSYLMRGFVVCRPSVATERVLTRGCFGSFVSGGLMISRFAVFDAAWLNGT